jgi:predicted Ser/Thr protein kinase
MRVNARFEGEYEQQVEYLTQATGMGVSDVLKASVEYYYQAMRAKDKPRLNNLRAFIGKLDSGRSDVASRYKEELGEAVAAKHGKPTKSGKK